MLSHVVPCLFPDGQQNALAFVVAGAVLVRFTEIAECDRSVNGSDDLAQADVLWGTCKGVAASDASFGLDQTGAFEGQEDLFEVGLRQCRALGNVLDRGRTGIFSMKSER